MNKPASPLDLHSISGIFFYDEQNIINGVCRWHRMTDSMIPGASHQLWSTCWCKPTLTYEDENGLEVWTHSYAC